MKKETELLIVDLYNEGLTYEQIRQRVLYKNTSIAKVVTKYGLKRRQAESEKKIAEEDFRKEKKMEKEKKERLAKARAHANMVMKRYNAKREAHIKSLEINWQKEKESH